MPVERRAPAFLAISLPTNLKAPRPPRSRTTPVARINHPTYLCRVRPIRVANTTNSAEEELFIRRNAANAQKKERHKPDVQFDFVQDPSTENARPDSRLVEKDRLPDLQPPPAPPPEVVPATAAPRVSTSEGKASQTTKPDDEKAELPAKPTVHLLSPHGLRGLADRLRRDTSRLITESHVGGHLRMPTGRETFTVAWELAIVLAILMLLRAGVASTLRWIHNRLNATRGLKSNIPYEASVFECMQRPLEFLSLFTVGTALAEAVSRPLAATGLLRHIMTLRELGIIFSATWFLLRWIDIIRSRFAADKRIDKAQLDATSRIATVATFVVSLLISLDTIGINVQTVLAFGGIGGVAIGFAGREIISNFFGGFMIYVTRPFSVGEWIRSIEEAELNGTVEDIGWYLTRVRTWDKRPLYIPNSRFSTLIVENGSRMDNRRILHTIHLRHEDMPVVPNIVADLENLLMSHQELDPRQHRLAYVDSFDVFSVKIWLSCYTKSVFLYDFRRVQQDILIKCHEIIRARGAKLATTNTRDVRPGVDTDRYGPFGSAATFGEATTGVSAVESAPAFTPTNSDVPGAPRYGRPNPMVTMHTIESGVDLSKLTQSSAPNGVARGDKADKAEVPAGSANRDDKPKSRPLSNAAVAATAAAFLAARRNAMRMEGIEKSMGKDVVAGKGETKDSSGTGSESKAAPSAPSGEMRITAAPPIRGQTGASPAGSSSGVSGTASGGSADAKVGDEGVSAASPAGAGSPQGISGAAEDSSKALKGTAASTSNSASSGGVMKITKGRKPIVPTAGGGTEGKPSPSPTANSAKAAQGAGRETTRVESRGSDTKSPDERTVFGTLQRGPPPSEDGTSAAKSATSGQSASSPSESKSGEDRTVVGTLQRGSPSAPEGPAPSKGTTGSQSGASSSGMMKITKGRPPKTVSMSGEGESKGGGTSSSSGPSSGSSPTGSSSSSSSPPSSKTEVNPEG